MFTTIFTTVFICWGLSEVAISLLFRTKTEPTKDAGTLKLVLIVAYTSLGVAVYLAIVVGFMVQNGGHLTHDQVQGWFR